MSAIVAEKESPSTALFVDYANLPDAVTEFVYPKHFGMAAEVSQVRINNSYPRREGKANRQFCAGSVIGAVRGFSLLPVVRKKVAQKKQDRQGRGHG